MGQHFHDREGRRALGQETEELGSSKKSWKTACKGRMGPACSSEGWKEGQGSPLGLCGLTMEHWGLGVAGRRSQRRERVPCPSPTVT